MNTVLRIISDNAIDVVQATRLLRKNRVSNDKLRKMARGECMFSNGNTTLREASKLALVQNAVARRNKANRQVKELQAKLAVDGGVLLPRRA